MLVPVTAWSLNFTVAKYALTNGFLPLAYTAPRFVFASLAFSAIALHRERTMRVRRRDFAILAAAGVVGVFLNQLTFVFALRHSSATTVALMFGAIPIFVGLLSHYSRRETLGARQWLAVAVSCAGVSMVVLGASTDVSADALGIALAIAAPLTWAVYSVGVAPLVGRYSALRVSAITCTIGTVPLLLVSIGDLRAQDWGSLGPLAWGAVIYGGLVAYVLATAVWLLAIKYIGAVKASLYQNLQPFLGALFAVLLLSEQLSLFEVAGGVVIAAGIAIAWRVQRRDLGVAELEARA